MNYAARPTLVTGEAKMRKGNVVLLTIYVVWMDQFCPTICTHIGQIGLQIDAH